MHAIIRGLRHIFPLVLVQLDFLQDVGWLSTDPEQRLAVLETHLRDNAHSSQSRQSQGAEEEQSRRSSSNHSSEPQHSLQSGKRGVTPPRNQQKTYSSGSPSSSHGQSSPGGSSRRLGGRQGQPNVKSKAGEVMYLI